MDKENLIKLFKKYKKDLSPREQIVFEYRFGLRDRIHTLEEIANIFYVTRERIRQIEARVIYKLESIDRGLDKKDKGDKINKRSGQPTRRAKKQKNI
jgi:DNA-directed RNA polymerase sigma subunit (sigma70/sigma32)